MIIISSIFNIPGGFCGRAPIVRRKELTSKVSDISSHTVWVTPLPIQECSTLIGPDPSSSDLEWRTLLNRNGQVGPHCFYITIYKLRTRLLSLIVTKHKWTLGILDAVVVNKLSTFSLVIASHFQQDLFSLFHIILSFSYPTFI